MGSKLMANNIIRLLQSKFMKGYSFSPQLIFALEEMKRNGLKPEGIKEITFDIKDLSKENIDLLLSVSDKFKILVNKDTFRLTQENCSKLVSLNEYIEENYSKSLSFPLSTTFDPSKKSEVWSIEKVLNANSKMEDWTTKINSARIDGKELSPFEKYMFAYRIVSNYAYNEEEREDSIELSRTVVGALNSDKLVCVGFADLLSHLCQRVGIECFQQDVACDGKTIDHCNCCVRIDDDKYNIHGVYYADPCWDSYSEETQNTLQHSLLRCDEVDKGFTKYPIAFRNNGLARFSKNGKQTYTYQQLKEIADRYTTKEQEDELLESITCLRQKFGVEVTDKREINLSYISSTFNPDSFYKTNISTFIEDKIDCQREQSIKEILQNMPDKEIAEAIKTSQICLECGNSHMALIPNEEGTFDKLNLEILDMVKNPTQVSKNMYCSALYNVFSSQGKAEQEAVDETKRVWSNSITEVTRTQSVGDHSFSTPFVEETKSATKETAEMEL